MQPWLWGGAVLATGRMTAVPPRLSVGWCSHVGPTLAGDPFGRARPAPQPGKRL